jgi:transglutaminase-like putative cysteine protease
MKKIFLFVALLSIKLSLFAIDAPKYPVNQIPEALLKDADAIVRNYQYVCQIINAEQHNINIENATTVLNENGNKQGFFYEMHDRFRKIDNLQGAIYDANGKLIRKLKKTEFEERSLNPDDGTSDSYRVWATPMYGSYPYTVVYTYTVSNKNPLWYPAFMPQRHLRTAVQTAQLKVVAPNKNGFRYKTINTAIEPQIEKNKEEQVFVWTFTNLPAILAEPWANNNDYFPTILTAPNLIDFEDYKGSLASWKDFGLFFYHLNENRLDLPDATTSAIKNLVANTNTIAEKVQLVYNYMQDKTRYISIQLGIGGWQCFAADNVDKNGYGDCKALSNYTKALLKAADVDASVVLINAESDPTMFPDFVSNQFNHVVLCVPNNADTIWLECTSQIAPFNFMGDFTNNRYALLVKPTGGELVRTPTPKLNDNVTTTTTTVQLPTEGVTLTVESEIVLQGELAYELIQMHKFSDRKEQEKWVQRLINPSDSRIETFTIKPPENRNNLNGLIKTKSTLGRGVTRAGKRLFVTPGVFSVIVEIPEAAPNRKTSVVISQPGLYVDTVQIVIPAGYSIEKLPETVKIESVFGQYNSTYKANGKYLQCIYSLQINATQQPSSTYSNFRQFLTDIRKANNKQISLLEQ